MFTYIEFKSNKLNSICKAWLTQRLPIWDRYARAVFLAGVLPLLLGLAACGADEGSSPTGNPGGSAGGGDTLGGGVEVLSENRRVRANIVPPPPPPPPDDGLTRVGAVPSGWEQDAEVWAEHAEFRGQTGLRMIQAANAYAKGITGDGITIGFVDTGLDVDHPEFAGKNIVLNDQSGLTSTSNSQLRHGTSVASIALGARGTGSEIHGVAFDADPAMWSLQLNSGYLSIDDSILQEAVATLEENGVQIINHSWGYSSTLNVDVMEAQQAFLENNFGETLERIRSGKSIHVWAAGNRSSDNIAVSSAWSVFFPELAGYNLVVAALGNDGAIGRLSNKCGAAYNHCLSAPGGVTAGERAYTRTARAGGGYLLGYGTSYAVPYVSGVLALMMQAFGDQLSLPEYSGRILATADKSGIYADKAVYGQGVVDIDAALVPFEISSIPLPSGGLATITGTGLDGGALPSEVIERLEREQIIILDGLDTPFTTSLVTPSQRRQDTERVQTRVQNLKVTDRMNAIARGHDADDGASMRHPLLANFANTQTGTNETIVFSDWAFAPMTLGKSAFGTDADINRQGFGFTLSRAKPNSRMAFGLVGEENSFMSTAGTGALKLGPAHSALFSLGRSLELGETTLTFDGHVSLSQSSGGSSSLVGGMERAVASSFGFGVHHGALSLEVKQPTFFETGTINLNVPYKRLAGGEVLFQQKDIPIRGSVRPFEVSLMHNTATLGFGVHVEKHANRPVETTFELMHRF